MASVYVVRWVDSSKTPKEETTYRLQGLTWSDIQGEHNGDVEYKRLTLSRVTGLLCKHGAQEIAHVSLSN